MKLTTSQKWEAIKALNDSAEIVISDDGLTFYCRTKVEIGGDGVLRGTGGRGSTRNESIDDAWEQLTNIPENKVIVINAMSPNRRQYRWNGFMWKEFPNPNRW